MMHLVKSFTLVEIYGHNFLPSLPLRIPFYEMRCIESISFSERWKGQYANSSVKQDFFIIDFTVINYSVSGEPLWNGVKRPQDARWLEDLYTQGLLLCFSPSLF